MSLYCHRKVNSIKGICGYQGTYHPCQDEANKCKYYDCRWLKNEDGCTLCVMCWEKMGFQDICEVCLSTRSIKEKYTTVMKVVQTKFCLAFIDGLEQKLFIKKNCWNEPIKNVRSLIFTMLFFKKIKKNSWRYHYFTPVYQKSW